MLGTIATALMERKQLTSQKKLSIMLSAALFMNLNCVASSESISTRRSLTLM